jgi:glucosylceramidase
MPFDCAAASCAKYDDGQGSIGVVDHCLGPTLRDDSAAMGLVTVNTETWHDVKFEREFYAMAHVSLAARPGSRPVETTIIKGNKQMPESQFSALGFIHQDGKRALFLMNSWDTDGKVEISWDEDVFDCAMPPKSLATMVWAD